MKHKNFIQKRIRFVIFLTNSIQYRQGMYRPESKRERKFLLNGFYFLLLLAALTIPTQNTQGQSVTPCTTAVNLGNFGVDADLYANFPAAIGGDDWFFSSSLPGTGIAVIGTTAATAKPPLMISAADFRTLIATAPNLAAKNRTYEQRMSVPFGTFVNGQAMIDALAARDHFSTSGLNDSTMFSGTGDKNGANPLTWNPNVGNVSQKLDLIDVGGHIRRDLTNGHLVGYAFATTLNTSGDDHIDFEIFRTSPVLNPRTNTVSNTGPAVTGGHTAGFFNSNGTVRTPGDLIVSVDYGNGGTNPQASVRIWVNPNNLDSNGMTMATLNALPARPFTFTGLFDTQLSTGTNGYGYAEIAPFNTSGACLFYALTNRTFKTKGTPWGNLLAGGSFSDSIAILQLAEIAIDFSAFGLDVSTQINQCQALFGSLLVKSRSSGSFTAQQKDYAGPYEFGATIPVSANAGTDKLIDCRPGNTSVQLQGSTTLVGANASWTVVPGSGGNIVSGANTLTPTVNAAGCYVLLVASSNPLFTTCNAKDTVCVTETVITPPAITCPGPVSQCPGSIPPCPANLAAFISAGGTASGAATPLVYSCSTGSLVGTACNGTYTRTHTITDACGRTASCTQVFTVKDTIAPFVTSTGTPAANNSNLGCNPSSATINAALGTATGTDNCSTVTPTSSDGAAVVSGCNRTQTRLFIGTDACGNTASTSRTMSWIADLTPPVITPTGNPGPNNSNLGCNPTAAAIDAALGTATATDNCGTVTPTPTTGAVGSNGCLRTQTRTWTASDACGNTASASRTINWTFDITVPVITATGSTANNANLGCNPSAAAIDAALGTATATDNCGPVTPTPTSGAVGSNGCLRTQTRTWTASDACANTASTSRTINWTFDTTAPVITATGSTANNANLGCNPSAAAIDAALGTASATDNCVSVTPTPTTGAVGSDGCLRTQTRTWTASDACGNTASAFRAINWTFDTTAPMIAATGSTANNANLGCNPSAAVIDAALGTATATDNCGPVTPTPTTGAVASNGCLRTQTRTWIASDVCGNTASASRTINWTFDIIPPVLTCPDDIRIECSAATDTSYTGNAKSYR